MSQYKLVRFNLNGKDVEKMVDVRASLTDMLRNDYHMTSVKKGCEVGECGACNVIIDGEAFNSCIYLAVWADGKHIRTLESLMGEDGELSDIQQAFLEEAAVQSTYRFMPEGQVGPACTKLYKTITAIQKGEIEDIHSWCLKV